MVLRKNWIKFPFWESLKPSLEAPSLCFFNGMATPGDTREPIFFLAAVCKSQYH